MELLESLEEDLKALEAEGVDPDTAKPEQEEREEPAKPAEEPAKPEQEEAKADPAQEEKKELSPAEQAYWRRKTRELEAENRRLKEARPAEQPKQAEARPEAKIDNPEPNKEEDLAGWLVWNAEEQRKWRASEMEKTKKADEDKKKADLYEQGHKEVERQESDYKKSNPDYENAIKHAESEYKRAKKLLNPTLSDADIDKEIKQEKLAIAVHCAANNISIGDTLYDMAIERFGYLPKAEEPVKDQSKSNLKIVSQNKRKSASSLEGGGQKAAGRVTLEQASQMSPNELLALSSDDWAYLESAGF